MFFTVELIFLLSSVPVKKSFPRHCFFLCCVYLEGFRATCAHITMLQPDTRYGLGLAARAALVSTRHVGEEVQGDE